ncbi:MAG: riboflavin synthase [Candidatus Omnitrophota bacterium]|nr:MAG: riboflavin synthase [Candidatus Omnitrophota bacterium]
MFSGIIEELGQIKKISRRSNVVFLEVKTEKIFADTKVGDSISVNGICLTVVKKERRALCFEVMPKTLEAIGFSGWGNAQKVNLERSLKVGDRISGHFVYGHIDCTGIVRQKRYSAGNIFFEIAVPAKFINYCLPKGSIAIDGISLTIQEIRPASFTVYIIPHTLKNTTLGFKEASDKVNIEFDTFAKRQKI